MFVYIMTNLEQFPKVEITKANGVLSVENLSQTNDLQTFKNWIDGYKKELLATKTVQEMQAFLEQNPILKWKTSTGNHALVFWKDVFVMSDEIDFENALKTIHTDIVAANTEIANSPVVKDSAEKAKVAANEVVKDTAKQVNDFSGDLQKDPTIQNKALQEMQKLIDEQKQLKSQMEEFLTKNAPTDAQADVKKMFELNSKLESADISNKALGTGAITANTVAALNEQNDYLRRQIKWYEEQGAKYKLEKFKPANRKSQDDLLKLMEMAWVSVAVEGTDKAGSTSAAKSIDKPVNQMTEAEKLAKTQEILGQLQWLQMTQQIDQSGKMSYVVNMSQAQMYALQTLNTLWGPWVAYSQWGIQQKNITEIANDRMVDKIQDALEKGKYRKAEKLSEKFSDRMEAQRRTMQNINAWTQNGANERNWSSYNYNVARWALGMARGNAYAGKTIDVIPYAPLFTNICQSVNTIIDRGHVTMDVVGLGPVICQCPERYNAAYNDAARWVANIYWTNQDAVDIACGRPWKPWLFGAISWLVEDGLSHTNMTKEQARKNATLLTGIGAIGVAYWLYQYIFKWSESKDSKWWFKRLWVVLWVGVWTNILSQAWTGMWLVDNLNKIKEVGFSKRWDTVTSWVDKNSAEYKWWEVKVFDNCFNNVPYGTLVACCEKWADGYPKVKNIDDMIAQLYVLLWTTTDPDRKAQLEGQIAFLKDLKKDPSKKDILNAAFVSMGLKYDEIADPSNATKTANEKIAATVKEKEEQAKKDAEAKAAKDKEAKEKKEKERTVDTSDPNVTNVNSKGTTTAEKIKAESNNPNDKLDRALHNIDLPLAQELQEARRNLMEGKAIEAHYKLVNGKLAVESYGMYTPLQYKDGKWFIGWFSDRRDAVPNYSQWFDTAAQAVWVANLTNRLIALETGRHDIDPEKTDSQPFNAESVPWNGSWLQISSGKRYKPDTDAVDGGYLTKSSTLREFGGDAFQNNIAAYARYLNGLTNKNNGKSIWSKDAKIAGVWDITNWFDQVGKMPVRKESDKVKNTTDTNTETMKPGPTAPTPEKAPEQANTIDTTNEAIAKKALELKNKFWWKDGGSKENPNNKYAMSDEFFKAWATAYMAYWVWNGPETFTFNYVDGNGKKKAILYKRQPWAKAPMRTSEVEGKR